MAFTGFNSYWGLFKSVEKKKKKKNTAAADSIVASLYFHIISAQKNPRASSLY